MDPTQLYETTIYDRAGRQAFSFVTVPARSLLFPEPPPRIELLATELGLAPVAPPDRFLGRPDPIQPWSLPFFVDAMMERRAEYRAGGMERALEWGFHFDIPNGRGPSEFAQYLAYAPVAPFESSPLSAKSLVQLLTGGGASAIGYLSGHPLFMLYTAAGIILCGAARGVADAMEIGARTTLLRWMGIEHLPDSSPREAEPAGGVEDEDEDEAS